LTSVEDEIAMPLKLTEVDNGRRFDQGEKNGIFLGDVDIVHHAVGDDLARRLDREGEGALYISKYRGYLSDLAMEKANGKHISPESLAVNGARRA